MSREGELGKNGGGFTLHVWALPEETALGVDEILCSTPETNDTVVIFHEGATRSGERWRCVTCGREIGADGEPAQVH